MALLNFIVTLQLMGLSVSFEVLKDEVPVPNQKVILLSPDGGQIEERITNSQGKVSFRVDEKKHPVIAGGLVYDGVPYISEGIVLETRPKHSHQIQVFPASSDTSQLAVSEMNVFIHGSESGIRFQQGFWIENKTRSTITPHPENGSLSFEVPSSAFDFQYERGFNREEVTNRGNTVILMAPIRPGRVYYSFSYSIDKARWRLELPQSFSTKVERLELLSDIEDLKILSPEARQIGQKFYAGGMREVYEANVDSPNFSLLLGGLPLNLPWPWWLPLPVCLGLIILVLLMPDRAPDRKPRRNLSDLLEDWLYLQKLKRENLIDEKEYRARKLRLVEELLPYFDKSNHEATGNRIQAG